MHAVTILPNSNAPIITMVPMIAPEKIVAIPITEKYAAIPAMVILVKQCKIIQKSHNLTVSFY